MSLRELSQTVLAADPGCRQWLLNGTSSQQNILLSSRGWQYAGFYAHKTSGLLNQNAQQNGEGHDCRFSREKTSDHILEDPLYIHLSRRPVGSTQWETLVFDDYKQQTDDGHNSLQLGICEGDGTIHLCFDQHSDRMRYRHSVTGLTFEPEKMEWMPSLFTDTSDTLPNTGSPILDLTYPRFLSVGTDMLFSYRTGMAGLGSEKLCHYRADTHSYAGLGTYLLGVQNNPYINGLDYQNGTLHVTWTYRDFVPFPGWDQPLGTGHKVQAGPNGIENNHDLNYAYSSDLGHTWKNDIGIAISTPTPPINNPIRPESPGICVRKIPKASGVHNQEAQVIDLAGGVHVLNRELIRGVLKWRHYYRSSAGKWQISDLPVSGVRIGGRRGYLTISKDNDLYILLPENVGDNSGDGKVGRLEILRATAPTQFRDYKRVWSGDGFSSEPRVDMRRLEDANVLSIYARRAAREVSSSANCDMVLKGKADANYIVVLEFGLS